MKHSRLLGLVWSVAIATATFGAEFTIQGFESTHPGKQPDFKASTDYIYVAGFDFLNTYTTEGDLVNVFELDTISLFPDETIFTGRPRLSSYAPFPSLELVYLNVSAEVIQEEKEVSVSRGLLLSIEGFLLGQVIDTTRKEPKNVFFRTVFDQGDGQILASQWNRYEVLGNQSISFRSFTLQPVEVLGGLEIFRINYTKASFGKIFFDGDSRMDGNKAMLFDQRSDNLLTMTSPWNNRMEIFDGNVTSKIGSLPLALPGFNASDSQSKTSEGADEILGVANVNDGTWVAYKLSDGLLKLIKIGEPASDMPDVAGETFGCITKDKLVTWKRLDNGDVTVKVHPLL